MVATEQKTKNWYKINKDVEYSTSFKFFSENQLRIVRTGTRHNFCSRLESKSFLETICLYKGGEYCDADIMAMSMKIHKEILAGKHGKGELVD
jgi:hypothetical protein